MAGCKSCLENCVLITQDCLCTLTGMKQTLVDLKPNIEYANVMLEELIGETCMVNLCSDATTETASLHEMLDNKKFQLYYSHLIKYDWACESGSGQISKSGYTVNQSDEFSDFRVLNGDEVQKKIDKIGRKLRLYRERFKKYLEESHTVCIEEDTKDCGCKSDCSCDCSTGCGTIKKTCHDYDEIMPI